MLSEWTVPYINLELATIDLYGNDMIVTHEDYKEALLALREAMKPRAELLADVARWARESGIGVRWEGDKLVFLKEPVDGGEGE